ncbi:MAG: YcbK family protein, partial [Deltaproteobacteria bacterium]
LTSSPGNSHALSLPGGRRSLSFYNTHTGEFLETAYWESGKYLSQPLSEIDYILRDHRTGQVIRIDADLLDFLHALRMKLRTQQPFHIISGYRSSETNAWLCRLNRGVVQNSLHVYGKAVDIRLPGCALSSLREAAMNLKRGGVGFYPRSDFIHVDVGRVRSW